jgi:hypothetical protein
MVCQLKWAVLWVQDVSSVPAPQTDNVRVKVRGEGLYAVASFSGIADPKTAAEQESRLRQVMQERGMKADGSDWLLARYNDPSTKPAFRRNEVLIPVKGFELW